MRANGVAVLAFSLICAGCAGCPPQDLAVINYSQLGACKVAQTGTGTVTAPPHRAVVIFKITNIDNTKINSSWSFDPSTLQINPPSSPQSNLGGQGPVSIAANTNVNVNRFVGIMIETSNADGTDAATVNYFLLYPLVPPAPGTIGAKANSNQVQYPFNVNCSALTA
jgi:hypothetical protein